MSGSRPSSTGLPATSVSSKPFQALKGAPQRLSCKGGDVLIVKGLATAVKAGR